MLLLALVIGVGYGGLDLAGAAPSISSVIVGNTAANPVPVLQQGTASVNVTNGSVPVSGSVGIDPSANTVALDPTDSGKLDTANGHLNSLDRTVSEMGFAAHHILETSATPPQPAGFAESFSPSGQGGVSQFGSTVEVSLVTVTGGADLGDIEILLGNHVELELLGPGSGGPSTWVIPVSTPFEADALRLDCHTPVAGGACSAQVNVVGDLPG
jgi:hypothetical protein